MLLIRVLAKSGTNHVSLAAKISTLGFIVYEVDLEDVTVSITLDHVVARVDLGRVDSHTQI